MDQRLRNYLVHTGGYLASRYARWRCCTSIRSASRHRSGDAVFVPRGIGKIQSKPKFSEVGAFTALWVIGYRVVQAAAPRLIWRLQQGSGPPGAAAPR